MRVAVFYSRRCWSSLLPPRRWLCYVDAAPPQPTLLLLLLLMFLLLLLLLLLTRRGWSVVVSVVRLCAAAVLPSLS